MTCEFCSLRFLSFIWMKRARFNLASQIIPNHYSDFLILSSIDCHLWLEHGSRRFSCCLQHVRSRIVCLVCVRYCSIDYNRILNGIMAIIRFSCNCIFLLSITLACINVGVYTHYCVPIMSLCQSFIEFVMSHRYSLLVCTTLFHWNKSLDFEMTCTYTERGARAHVRALTCICVNVCSYLLRSKCM